jgi:hypothetical protein
LPHENLGCCTAVSFSTFTLVAQAATNKYKTLDLDQSGALHVVVNIMQCCQKMYKMTSFQKSVNADPENETRVPKEVQKYSTDNKTCFGHPQYIRTKGPSTRVRIYVRIAVGFRARFVRKQNRDSILFLSPITIVCLHISAKKKKNYLAGHLC